MRNGKPRKSWAPRLRARIDAPQDQGQTVDPRWKPDAPYATFGLGIPIVSRFNGHSVRPRHIPWMDD